MPRYKARDGAELYFRSLGRGKPIVMLHGFGMHSGHWSPYAWLLARKYHVIVPDLRGFGRSRFEDFYDTCAISNLSNDLEDLIKHLGIDDFKLIGISMGALTALSYLSSEQALTHLERYMHIDQSPYCMNDTSWSWGLFGHEHDARMLRARALLTDLDPYLNKRAKFEELPLKLRQSIFYELAEFFASALSGSPQKRLARAAFKYEQLAKKLLPVENWSAYFHCLKAYITQGYDFRENLRSCAIPVDILVGMKSEMYPAAGQLRMADYHSNARVIPFKDSGHAPLIDQPVKLTKTLFEFASA